MVRCDGVGDLMEERVSSSTGRKWGRWKEGRMGTQERQTMGA